MQQISVYPIALNAICMLMTPQIPASRSDLPFQVPGVYSGFPLDFSFCLSHTQLKLNSKT